MDKILLDWQNKIILFVQIFAGEPNRQKENRGQKGILSKSQLNQISL